MDSPISLRIPADVLQKIDAEGKRGTVINQILREHYPEPSEQQKVLAPAKAAGVPYVECQDPRAVTAEVSKAIATHAERRGHDPKTCNVYKCGMCAAVKA